MYDRTVGTGGHWKEACSENITTDGMQRPNYAAALGVRGVSPQPRNEHITFYLLPCLPTAEITSVF
jgi:hypothetical protein